MQDLGGLLIRRRLRCGGVVQGVGFRPAVHRLARELELVGFVQNDVDGVCIEVQGSAGAVQAFVDRLPRVLPPLADLRRLDVADIALGADATFTVADTAAGRRGDALVPPDVAMCPNCRAELDDPADRRHRYPFTTCTDCGPRFSLVRELPYDRVRTSMACFPLCPRCAAEYRDAGDRRFHAETVCCPDCGPRLWLVAAAGRELASGGDALALARAGLTTGALLALKGLGGFQLACRADLDSAVQQLRQKKQRPSRPLAVMARDLAAAEQLVQLTADDLHLLQSPQSPIVLARRRPGAAVAPGLAPGLEDLGVMLPTTPLHVELFRDAAYDALVMTSGNRSDEPICLANREAVQRLGGIADLFLLHDRDVVRRVDDSVVRSAPFGPTLVRRSRGYAPLPLALPVAATQPILALGPYLQATVCLATGPCAFVSQHVGDLDSEASRAFLREVALGLEGFLAVECDRFAADEHPDYPSRWLAHELAQQRGGAVLHVQHHLAHAAAVLGEHDRFPAPGECRAALVLDGTGSGPDGTAWGNELLQLDGDLHWCRAGWGEALPLVGGEAAVREPWRIAAAVLAGGDMGGVIARLPLGRQIDAQQLVHVAALSQRGSWPQAHGAGRLFEAAGAMLGLGARNGYEGETAARLEALASMAAPARPWPEVALAVASATLPQRRLLLAAARRLLAGEDAAAIAAGLFATFASLCVQLVRQRLPADTRELALGGGCMINRLLQQHLVEGLAAVGIEALLPRRLPPGDGGIAYGQAVVAAVAAARATIPTYLTTLPEDRACALPSRCS